MENSNMFSYISNKNPDGVWELLKKEGYDRPGNKKQLAYLLADLFKRKENSHKEIAGLHPDKEFILYGTETENNNVRDCSGCALATMSAEGTEGKKLSEKTLNTIIISGSAILIAVLVGTLLVKGK